MPAPTDTGHHRPRRLGLILGLGLCAAVVLLALGLFQEFSAQPPPPQQAAPQAAATPAAPSRTPSQAGQQTQAVEVSPGTATDGHFVIRLLGGTSSR